MVSAFCLLELWNVEPGCEAAVIVLTVREADGDEILAALLTMEEAGSEEVPAS